MIIADTNIWVDHFRSTDPCLIDLLQRGEVLMHPFVLGELVLGNVPQQGTPYGEIVRLLEPPVASPAELLRLIGTVGLSGSGIGYVDAHLLASAVAGSHRVWTRDRTLNGVADRLGLAYHQA